MGGAKDVVQFVKCLPFMHEALGLSPRNTKISVVAIPIIPVLMRQRQEDSSKFKACLVYILNSRQARAMY